MVDLGFMLSAVRPGVDGRTVNRQGLTKLLIDPTIERLTSQISSGMVWLYASLRWAPSSEDITRLPAKLAGPANCLYASITWLKPRDSHSGPLTAGMLASMSMGRLYTTCAEYCESSDSLVQLVRVSR